MRSQVEPKCYMITYPSVLRSPSVFRVWAAIPSEYMALSQTFSVTSHLKFYRFSTWFTTVSRQCRYSAGRRRASTSIKFSRGLTCLHAHLYVKCRQVNNCMYTSNFGPSHHQSGLPKPKCDRLKWCKAGFWSAWPVAHCLKDTQALLCMGHIDRGQLSSSLCHGPSQNCMSMIIMYVNSLQRGPLTNHLLKRNLEH